MSRAVLVLVALPVIVLLARMQLEGRAFIAEADRLADRSDPESLAHRVELLGRAARRLGGPAGRARSELAQLGRRGIPGAWNELRSAILATRWLFTPDRALLDEANAALAEQRAREHLAAGTPPAPEVLAHERDLQLARLEATGEPSRIFSLLAILGLFACVGAFARGLLHRPSRRVLVLGCAGVCAFLLGLWRA